MSKLGQPTALLPRGATDREPRIAGEGDGIAAPRDPVRHWAMEGVQEGGWDLGSALFRCRAERKDTRRKQPPSTLTD